MLDIFLDAPEVVPNRSARFPDRAAASPATNAPSKNTPRAEYCVRKMVPTGRSSKVRRVGAARGASMALLHPETRGC